MILNHDMPLKEISSVSESSNSDTEEQMSKEKSISINIQSESSKEEQENGIINLLTQRELTNPLDKADQAH